jgi:hypothetical protein
VSKKGSINPSVPEGLVIMGQKLNTDGNTNYWASAYSIPGYCYDKPSKAILTVMSFIHSNERMDNENTYPHTISIL